MRWVPAKGAQSPCGLPDTGKTHATSIHQVVTPCQVKKMPSDGSDSTMYQLHMTCFLPPILISSVLPGCCRSLLRRLLLLQCLLRCRPAERQPGSPFSLPLRSRCCHRLFTACPTDASIFTTLPGTEAVTFTEPAPAEASVLLSEQPWEQPSVLLSERLPEQRFRYPLQRLRHMRFH